MPTATVTSKRQITLPAETCRELRIVPGTRIDFIRNAAGEVVLRPKAGDIRKLRGVVAPPAKAVSVEDMKAAIGDAVADDFRRKLR